jgi:hypothetical protein
LNADNRAIGHEHHNQAHITVDLLRVAKIIDRAILLASKAHSPRNLATDILGRANAKITKSAIMQHATMPQIGSIGRFVSAQALCIWIELGRK